MTIQMFKPDAQKSHVLEARVADLKSRLHEARISDGEMRAFQKVAAIMADGQDRIDGDDLIAASFLADSLE